MIDESEIVKEEPIANIRPVFPNDYTIKEKIRDGLKKIDSMSDVEAYEFIAKNIHNLFANKEYEYAFVSDKFLIALQQVCHEVPLEYSELVVCNSILYNKLCIDSITSYKKKLMYIVGEVLNKYTVNQLLGNGVEDGTAIYGGICNASSDNMVLNIRRLNFALTTFEAPSPKFYTIQKFVNIYGSLYRECLSNLLSAIVFDTEIKRALKDDEYWVTKEMIEIDENIGWAGLFILESIPPQNITSYLISISEEYKFQFDYDSGHTKISFHNLPNNLFRKIPVIVEQLEGLDDPVILP